MEPKFADRVQRLFAEQCGDDPKKSANLEEYLRLSESIVQCSSNMAATATPTPDEIRVAFEAHDARAGGQGRLAVDELVNLTRYLQVRVALATLMETEARNQACP